MPHKPKLRVMLVDDLADDTDIFGNILDHLDCEVKTCNDPAQCISLAEEFQPHLLFVDYAMPGQRGPAIARTLSTAAFSQTPSLVARTGYTTESVKRECLDAGFSHVLIKPVDVGQLTALLEEARAFAFRTGEK